MCGFRSLITAQARVLDLSEPVKLTVWKVMLMQNFFAGHKLFSLCN